MTDLTEAEERAIYLLGLKIEEGVDWQRIAAMFDVAPSAVMADAWIALRKVRADD